MEKLLLVKCFLGRLSLENFWLRAQETCGLISKTSTSGPFLTFTFFFFPLQTRHINIKGCLHEGGILVFLVIIRLKKDPEVERPDLNF